MTKCKDWSWPVSWTNQFVKNSISTTEFDTIQAKKVASTQKHVRLTRKANQRSIEPMHLDEAHPYNLALSII